MKYLSRQRFRLQAVANRIWPKKTIADQPAYFSGIRFRNPLGISAGIDRDAHLLDVFDELGAGFVELGTINNISHGVFTARRLMQWRRRTPDKSSIRIGVSIGSLNDKFDNATIDECVSISRLFSSIADFIVFNLSRPRSAIRSGHVKPAYIRNALHKLRMECNCNRHKHPSRLLVKLAITPAFKSDSPSLYTDSISEYCDGIITTFEEWPSVTAATNWLSANPIELPLIAVGGVQQACDVEQYLAAGATLVGTHRAVRAHGPAVLRKLAPTNVTYSSRRPA